MVQLIEEMSIKLFSAIVVDPSRVTKLQYKIIENFVGGRATTILAGWVRLCKSCKMVNNGLGVPNISVFSLVQ